MSRLQAENDVLEVSELWFSYRRVPALRGISFDVRASEVVALVGPNGAGKSTTMKVVSGLLSPDRGTVRLDGGDIGRRSPEQVARLGVSLVPEGRHVFTRMNVRENLELGTVMGRADAAHWDGVLDHFPFLRGRLDTPAGKLSGGEQQQLVIARALLTRPRLLLLDEPSLGLGPRIVDLIYEILAALRESGLTLLIVEQSLERVLDVADRIYVMRSGAIALSGRSADLRESAGLQQAYFGIDAADSAA